MAILVYPRVLHLDISSRMSPTWHFGHVSVCKMWSRLWNTRDPALFIAKLLAIVHIQSSFPQGFCRASNSNLVPSLDSGKCMQICCPLDSVSGWLAPSREPFGANFWSFGATIFIGKWASEVGILWELSDDSYLIWIWWSHVITHLREFP